jgi:hypothetical protein
MRRATPDAKRCSAAPLCGVPSPGACAGAPPPTAGRRAPAADRARPWPAPRRRAARSGAAPSARGRTRPRRAASRPRRLFDVGAGVAADALRVAEVHLVTPGRRGSCSRSGRETPRWRATALRPCPGSSRGEVVAEHGVHRVEELAARRGVPRTAAFPSSSRAVAAAGRAVASPSPWRPRSQRHAEELGPAPPGTAGRTRGGCGSRSRRDRRPDRATSPAISSPSPRSSASRTSTRPSGSRIATRKMRRARDRGPWSRGRTAGGAGRRSRAPGTRSAPWPRGTCSSGGSTRWGASRRSARVSVPSSSASTRYRSAPSPLSCRTSTRSPSRANGASSAVSTHGRNRVRSQTSAPSTRRQNVARPAASAHTDTMPGVGSQPHSHSSSGVTEGAYRLCPLPD